MKTNLRVKLFTLALFTLLFAFQALSGERRAVWIAPETAQGQPNTWLIYRKDVKLDAVPTEMFADIAADTKYWLWINGEPVVFEGGLKRGPAPNSIYFDRVDIAPYLKVGDNTIAVLVWHFGKNGFSHVDSGSAGLFFEAISPEAEIVSDNSWQSDVYDAYGDTEAPYPNFRLPESNIRFDARKERRGWNMPGYKKKLPGAFYIADASNSPFGKLVERPIPMWKDYGLKAYESTRRSGDTIICRLPYNCQMTPYLKVKAPAGKTIGMQTDNYMGGSTHNMRAEYVTRDGEQEYESLGWLNGHEMMYIVPEGVEVLDLKYRETGYDTEFSGSFTCSDPFLNELYKRSARTLYITMRDTYMDCPDRERAQWWGVEYQSSRSGAKALFTLDNLWDGLGSLTVLNPEIKYLFGKVTMYPSFKSECRDMILYFLHKHFPDHDNLVRPINPLKTQSDFTQLAAMFTGSNFKEDYKILNAAIREQGLNIPPLVNSYMSLSPTMRMFGTAINDEFGDVEESGIFLAIDEILEEKKERHINTFRK